MNEERTFFLGISAKDPRPRIFEWEHKSNTTGGLDGKGGHYRDEDDNRMHWDPIEDGYKLYSIKELLQLTKM